jgi:hypothetical protein
MYQYTNSGKVYGDIPPPIDARATLIHVGGNSKGLRTKVVSQGRRDDLDVQQLMRSSVQIGKHWRNKCGVAKIRMEGKYIPSIKKNFWSARVEFSTSTAKF